MITVTRNVTSKHFFFNFFFFIIVIYTTYNTKTIIDLLTSTYTVYNNYKNLQLLKSITLPTKIYNNSITYALLTIQCDYRCYNDRNL